MKRIYFVRHGETLANRKHRHQGPYEPLSDKGRLQAKAVATTLKQNGVKTLMCSDYVRARETAEIIGKELKLPHREISSVVEFRRPNFLYGKRHLSLLSLWYIWLMFWHRQQPDWDYDGAENMFQIRNRVLDVKQEISQVNPGPVAVVSHSIFIDMFVQIVCADRSLTLKEFIQALSSAKKLPNTGVVAFEVDENAPNGTCNWWLVESETDNQYLRVR